MKYDDLIERLRRNAEYQKVKGWGNDALLHNAADAIAALQRKLSSYDAEETDDE